MDNATSAARRLLAPEGPNPGPRRRHPPPPGGHHPLVSESLHNPLGSRAGPVLAALLGLAAGLPAQDRARPEAPPPAAGGPPYAVELRDDLAYAEHARDRRRNRLDLWLPRGVSGPPLLMFVHGGTWMAGSKERHEFVGRAFARSGIATAVINYRLSPMARHPAHVQDCAAAFAWLYRHAGESGFDRDRMFLIGHSAGAHLVSLLALDPQWLRAEQVPMTAVKGVIALSAPFDVRRNNSVFFGVFGHDEKVRAEASPLLRVRRDAPPFLVMWAERELLHLGDDNEAMVQRMTEVGLRHRAATIAGHGHVSYLFRIGKEGDPVTPAVLEALEEWSAEH